MANFVFSTNNCLISAGACTNCGEVARASLHQNSKTEETRHVPSACIAYIFVFSVLYLFIFGIFYLGSYLVQLWWKSRFAHIIWVHTIAKFILKAYFFLTLSVLFDNFIHWDGQSIWITALLLVMRCMWWALIHSLHKAGLDFIVTCDANRNCCVCDSKN